MPTKTASVHTLARYYEPTSGRFLSADPMGQGASPSLYDFASGDPVNFFDPTGRCPNNSNQFTNGLYKPTEVNLANTFNDPGTGGQNPVDPNPGVLNGVATAALDGGTRFLKQLFSDIVNAPQNIVDAAGSAAAGIVNLVDPGTRSQAVAGLTQDIQALGNPQTYQNLVSSLTTPEGLANAVFAVDLGIAGSALATASSGTAVAEEAEAAAEADIADSASTARLPQDANVNPTPPEAMDYQGRTVGPNPAQNAMVAQDAADAEAEGATDIRVNQQQVDSSGDRMGINRPDLQYTDADGNRVYIEYDTNPANGTAHETRILSNDPSGTVILKTVK